MIKDILEHLLSFFKSRLLPMVTVFIVLFILLIVRLFDLQIVNGESYLTDFSVSIEKTMSVPATRGRIFDRNGKLLAYNELAFCVKIADSGTYSNNDDKNKNLNEIIEKTLNIIEENGDTVTNTLQIAIDENDNYEFTIEGNELLRFLRDSYGVKSIDELSNEQKESRAQDVVDYYINRYDISTEYKKEHILEIINLRRSMSANSYNRYMQFNIAYEVSDKTVAAIMENSITLTGVTIEEEYIRKYNDSKYYSHIIGYTGNISSSELAELNATEERYEMNDVVGKTGIEQSFESELQGTKGSKTVYVDTVGRVTEVLSETPPQTGNDVYLSIDFELQKDIYNAIENRLSTLLLEKIVPTDVVYKYTSSGTIEDIYIPIKKVYFALINNNIISINEIAKQKTSVQENVYDKFLAEEAVAIDKVKDNLLDDSTPNGRLSEEMQMYINYIYDDFLTAKGIINNNINKDDTTYKAWKKDTISIKEFLTYAIAQNWINLSKFTGEQYSSLSETYEKLVDFIASEIKNDKGFAKKVYKSLIDSSTIYGSEICLMLFDQGVLSMDDDDYNRIASGSLSAYAFLTSKISNREITPGQLALEPCSGAAVVTDVKTGELLAMVSYPTYDANKLSGTVDAEYYSQLRNDLSKPLLSRATTMQSAPGSTFKICSSIAALEEQVYYLGEELPCAGIWDKVEPNPKCWVYPSSHGHDTVQEAIRDSCNCFFYEIGWRLATDTIGYNSIKGTATLKKYAEDLGLATKANIEIYESEPQASNTNAIQSAIGQGNHNYTALNLARYVTTIATSGTCYNLSLMKKIVKQDGTVVKENFSSVDHKMQVKQSTWDAVHTGMSMVPNTYAAFAEAKVELGGKSGTAQENLKLPDHAMFISYAPYSSPEIAVSAIIPNGYSGSSAAYLTNDIMNIYFDK